MRILLVTEDLPSPTPGGAAMHAAVLGNALLDAGHDVHLLGYRHQDTSAHAAGFRGPVHARIDFAGARWQESRLGAFMPMARPHTARRIWRAIRSLPGPWDVVHYHGHNPLVGTIVPADWNFVHTLHDQGADCIVKTRFRDGAPCRETSPEACAGCATSRPNALQRTLSASAVTLLRQGAARAYRRHRAVFVSDFVRQRFLQSAGADGSDLDLRTVHNFVDAARMRAARAADPAPWPASGRRRVFMAGRLDAAKGFAALFDALDDAALARLDVVVAGGGPDGEALKRRHEPRGVRWLGWLPPADVLRWTRAADVCVVPSACEEACATTVLEALALGRPVYALSRGGTPELARYGLPGQLRLFSDHAALARALANEDLPLAAESDRANVDARLPELLAVYRRAPLAAAAEVMP